MTIRCLRFPITIFVFVLPLKAQDPVFHQRITDWAKMVSSARFLSATRYVPVMLGRGHIAWSASENVLDLNGMPFEAFPLNLISPDYAPIDPVTAGDLEVSPGPHLSLSGSYSGGRISFRSSTIPDSLVARVRMFGGSETGDVILQEYIRDDLTFFNRNKTGPSAIATVSSSDGSIGFRVTGGAFSYFSVGYADRDRTILRYVDLETFARPNRHFIGSVEALVNLEEDGRISVLAGMNAFDAWEQVPFLPVFTRLSGSLGTVRFSARQVVPFVDVEARRDGVALTMGAQLGMNEGRYTGSVTSVRAIPHLAVNRSIEVQIPVEIARHEIEVPDQNTQLFREDRSRSTWAVGIDLNIRTPEWKLDVDGRYERGLHGSFMRSAGVDFMMDVTEREYLRLRLNSVERSPSVLEMFGEFEAWRFRPALARTDTFRVTGNATLRSSRTTGVEFSYTVNAPVRFTGTAFAVRAHHPIQRRPSNAIRSAYPGDMIFSGQYINGPVRTLAGVECGALFDAGDQVTLECGYTYTGLSEMREVPRHQGRITGSISITPGTTMTLTVAGISKTVWEEFALDPSRDEQDGIGTDGIAPEYWSVDCSVLQSFGRLWMLNELKARLEIQNLLNRTQRLFPIGVTTDLTVMGYISFVL